MRIQRSAFSYYIVLSLIYLLLGLLLPVSAATRAAYNISGVQYHLLVLLISLPFVAIWWAAFYGYGKISDYAQLIKNSPEGRDFHAIAVGTRWLAWGLPLPSIISLILSAIANQHPAFHAPSLIISNYVTIILTLVAFSFISSGSRTLAQREKQYLNVTSAKNIILLFVILGVVFCFFVFRHISLQHVGNAVNPYFLPTWLVLLTVIIPYLYAWLIGLLSAYEIQLVAQHTSGILYRRALNLLGAGLAVVIATSIGAQYLRAIIPRSGHLALSTALLIVYIFEIIAAVGYILLARGAQRLKKIEEA